MFLAPSLSTPLRATFGLTHSQPCAGPAGGQGSLEPRGLSPRPAAGWPGLWSWLGSFREAGALRPGCLPCAPHTWMAGRRASESAVLGHCTRPACGVTHPTAGRLSAAAQGAQAGKWGLKGDGRGERQGPRCESQVCRRCQRGMSTASGRGRPGETPRARVSSTTGSWTRAEGGGLSQSKYFSQCGFD